MRRAVLMVAAAAVALVSAAGVAWAANVTCQEGARVCGGSNQADKITGTPTEDNAYARRGADVVTTLDGSDTIQGGAGEDRVYGGNDSDFVFGGETGRTTLIGSGPPPGPFSDRSDDLVFGGPGNDFLIGGYGQGGQDDVFGGAGDDQIQTAQRGSINEFDIKLTREVVDCGPGVDSVSFDQGVDVVSRNTCENLQPVPPGGGGPVAAEGFGRALFR